MAADPILAPEILSGDPVISEAKRRWDRCSEFESTARQRFLNDWRFANGDSDNGYQWPGNISRERGLTDRPCLTMNVVRQHNFQIVNEARRNKSAIKIIPMGNGATVEAAGIWKQLIRHIEYQSNAQAAYGKARQFQTAGGIGWWRIVTDYVGVENDNQTIYIKQINDPLSVFLDPDAQEADGSDATFAFVFDSMPRDGFNDAYPKWKDKGTGTPLGVGVVEDYYNNKWDVRICEYFRKVTKSDTLINFIDPRDQVRKFVKKSLLKDFPEEEVKVLLDNPMTKTRDIEVPTIEWRLIVGEEVVDKTEWMGKYIPLIKIVGEEIIVDGILDRKGHTRAMKDAQRMYNYNASSQVEFVALQGKSPWIAPAKAIEELESMWNTANTVNHSVLIWNHLDEDRPDTPIPPPFKPEPPNASPAYQQGMEVSFNQMMMTSGQWQNQMGMGGNERTGRAIAERQEQSDTSTYHFQDNYGQGLIYTGRQLIDLIPKIFDTKQVLQIMADDGTDLEIEIDPTQQKAYQEFKNHQGKVVKRVLNPQVGKFDIASGVGPEMGSKRRETVDALTLILTQAPALTPIIGDLLLKAMDFDEALEASARLKRMIPPVALGQGPSESEQKLTQQVRTLQMQLAKSLQEQGKSSIKLAGKAQARDIDVYEAETKRMQALAGLLPQEEAGLSKILKQLVEDAVATHLTHVQNANASDVESQSPSPPPRGNVLGVSHRFLEKRANA